MTVLGNLGDGDTHESPWSQVFKCLMIDRRLGTDFDSAWRYALREAGITDTRVRDDPADVGVVAFARERFERAFYRLDPSKTNTLAGRREWMAARNRMEADRGEQSGGRDPVVLGGDRGRPHDDRARAVAA